jgi:hypothetical protein
MRPFAASQKFGCYSYLHATMATSKTGSGKESPSKGYLILTVVDRAFTLATDLIWAGCFVAIAYIVYLCVRELAGHTTIASFVLEYFSNAKGGASAKPWIGSTVLCGAWGVAEKWLRRRKVGSMSKRIKDLEEMLDSNRSSSGLTRTGQVPKKTGPKHD